MKLFWPSRPIFSQKFPPKYPQMMTIHVVGTLWYLNEGLGHYICLQQPYYCDPIYYSKSKMEQICQSHYLVCEIDLNFRYQQTYFYKKTPRLGLKWFLWVKNSLFRIRISQQIPPNDTKMEF